MPTPPSAALRNVVRNRWVPWIMLGVALATTAWATFVVDRSESAFMDARFENAIESAGDRIQGRIELYEAALRGLASLFAASEVVTRDEFRTYATRLDLPGTYPGVQGVGWAERIVADPAGSGDVTRIRYLEPQDARNRAALGYDMFSEPTRRRAMAWARDSGDAALSGKVTLVQEIYGRKQPGFLLYMPVYTGDGNRGDVTRRRTTLRGYVYAAFRAQDLFAGIFGSERQPGVSFRVYDGTAIGPEALLHVSPHPPGFHLRSATRVLLISGRPWTVVFDAEPTTLAPSRFPYVPGTAAAGTAISLILFLLALGLERSARDAQRANLAKARFLANMSHELRTPLNAICGYVDLLQAGVYGPATEDQQMAYTRINVASGHLLRLIEDVLTFARLEAGRTTYNVRPLAVADALDRAETLVLPQAAAAGLRYRRADDANADPWIAIVADPDKLQQVLLNLLSNAVKFTPRGGEIVVSVARQAHHVTISIADTGIGIAPEQMNALFAPFVQIDGALTRQHQGAGLGLAISRELARGMGGEITASSTPGEGSVFHLLLPRALATPPPSHRAAPGKPEPTPA